MRNTLKQYVDLAGFIAGSLGDSVEVMVFDTSEADLPVVCHYNKLTGTEKPTRELLKEALKSPTVQNVGRTLNRPTVSDNKKIIKTSILLIKDLFGDDHERIVGALILNINCRIYFEIEKLLKSIMKFNTCDIQSDKGDFFAEVKKKEPPTLGTIEKMVIECGVEPGKMSSDERIELICDLYDEGYFEIKGSVAKAAEQLKISEKTIYRHLSDIKKARSI